jgi:hypothetical protein
MTALFDAAMVGVGGVVAGSVRSAGGLAKKSTTSWCRTGQLAFNASR